eukprot:GEZU01011801.1.p2 GENE.GEZU01011801.1~~GEZU01011801.1.p2  ORF type:complete len:131 (-),score=6.70 GEZU01011801.1:215-607(-)
MPGWVAIAATIIASAISITTAITSVAIIATTWWRVSTIRRATAWSWWWSGAARASLLFNTYIPVETKTSSIELIVLESFESFFGVWALFELDETISPARVCPIVPSNEHGLDWAALAEDVLEFSFVNPVR